MFLFFPNAQKVLKRLKKNIKKNGVIAMSVHSKTNVPYFDSILHPVKKFIPDFIYLKLVKKMHNFFNSVELAINY